MLGVEPINHDLIHSQIGYEYKPVVRRSANPVGMWFVLAPCDHSRSALVLDELRARTDGPITREREDGGRTATVLGRHEHLAGAIRRHVSGSSVANRLVIGHRQARPTPILANTKGHDRRLTVNRARRVQNLALGV